MNARHCILSSLALVLLSSGVSRGGSIVWTNTAGGNWSLAGNWSTQQLPGPADDVTLVSGSYTLTNDTTASVNSLTFPGTGIIFNVASNTVFSSGAILFNGGTINDAGSIYCGGLSFTAGTFNGPGSINLSGSNSWTGGVFSGYGVPGTMTIQGGASFYIAGSGNMDVPGWTVNNNGTVNHTGGQIRGGLSGTLIVNAGLWQEELDIDFINAYGGGPSVFLNTGTFRKTVGNVNTTTTTFDAGFVFNNGGLVDVQMGGVYLYGGGTNSGTFNAATNTYVDVLSPYQFNDGSVFSGDGNNYLSANGIGFNGSIVATNSGNLLWYFGTIVGSLTVPAGSTLNIVSSQPHDLPNSTLTNNGTVVHTGGQIRGGLSGTLIANAGLWQEEVDIDFINAYGGGPSVFLNTGTFRKTAGAGNSATTFDASFLLNNSGLVDAEAGNIVISGGGTNSGTFNAETNFYCNFNAPYSFNDGSQFLGTGNNYWESTMTFNGSILATNPANLIWYDGSIAGSLTIPPGSTLNIISGNPHYLPSATLTNNGTVIDTGGQIRGVGGWTIYNNGLWVEAVDNFFYNDTGGVDTFVNAGTFRKTAGTGFTYIGYLGSQVAFNNSGLVDAQSGTIYIQGGGTNSGTFNAATNAANTFAAAYSFNEGSLFTGAGQNNLSAGTLTFNGNITSVNFVFNGATTVGAGVLTLLGTNTWVDGSLEAPMTVPSGSTLNIVTGNPHSLSGGILTNNGTVINTGGNMRGSGGWTIYNNGLWLEEVDFWFYNDGGGVDTFVNAGTFRKTAGAGFTYIGWAGTQVAFNNSGLVDAQSGTIDIEGGGINSGTFNAGANGVCNFIAAYTFNNGSAFTGGGNNTLNANGITFNGSITSSNLEWNSGILYGTAIISYGSTFSIVGSSDHDLPGMTLQNYGTVIHTGGQIRGGVGTLIDNEGIWQEQLDAFFYGSTYGGASAFLNNGTFDKTTTTATTTFDGAFPFNNNGALEVLSGTVSMVGGYTQSDATLIFGLSSLSSYGTLNISGNVNLNGTVGVELLNGFVPVAGNTFTPMTFATESGRFANYDFPALPGGLTWTPSYSTKFILIVGGAATNDTGQISGTVTDNQGHPIAGASVFAMIDPNSFTNLIQNGSFETPSDAGLQYIPYGIGSTNITGWTVFGPPGDNVATISYLWNAPAEDGLQFFDPTGTTGGAGIEQSFPTVSNQTYILSFYHGTYSQHGTANALGVTLRSSSYPNLVQNGSFETPSDNGANYILYGIGSTDLTGWTVIGPANANIAIHNNYVGQAIDGTQWLDPTGNTGGAGVTQTLSTVSNQAYVLFFYHASYSIHGIANALGVTVGANFHSFGETSGSGYDQWVQESVPFTATSNLTTLTFQDVSGITDANDNFVDDVVVVPASLAILVTNFGTYSFGEMAGTSGNFDWTQERTTFTAVSSSTTLAFRDLNNYDANNNFLDNVVIGPADNGAVLGAVTDANGHYQITVGPGTFQVGVDGLPALGYNDVSNQSVTVSTTNGVANFVASPFSGQTFTVTSSVNPPGAGTILGGGTFPQNTTVTVTATPVSVPPYIFVNWTENGFFQSANAAYAFPLTRDRQLVANFTLPLYSLSVSNNPPGAGTVGGAGSYYYGTTNLLTAFPSFGYSFSNWIQGSSVIGTSPSLSVGVYSNQTIVANYTDANLVHTVTTATSPPGLALLTGAGIYTNGQTAIFNAPLVVTNPPFYYHFSQFTLSNTLASASPGFSKTFSTLDPTNLQYVAVYAAQTIQPLLKNVTANFANPIPATTTFLLALQFDRTMQTNSAPALLLTNTAPAAVQATVAANGYWTGTVFANDTYHTPPITFAPGMDGTIQLYVSGAQDTNGSILALTNAATFVLVATPPPNPFLTLASSNSSSAVVDWSAYSTPPNLNGFRVFLQSTNYGSVAGLSVLTGLGSGARSFQFGNLALDTPYYAAIQAFDVAGNASPYVTTLKIFLPSTMPPPVLVQDTPVGASSASLSWNSYNTASLFGFTGFRLYSATSNFTSVAGLIPTVTLAPSANSFQVNGLIRTNNYYFAVVGYNDTNGFNPNVTTASWTDPYAGNIGVNTTIGGAGQSVVNINHSMVVINNAILTLLPGTTLLFAPGASLTVQQGSLVANGSALSPIVLDSANDSPGNTPAAGDWGGVILGSGAGSSSLSFVEVLYGGGLTLSGCSPVVNAFTANNNSPFGLGLQNGATLTTSNALLTANAIGMEQMDTAVLTIQNSVIQNNGTNALAGGSPTLAATSNWWGTAAQTDLAALLQGNVSFSPFLTYEPLLTPALGASNGLTQVGSPSANLQLACRTADSMRISEDYTFAGVFFTPFSNYTAVPLSAGGGLKHIYAQYRSVTGQTNPPLEVDITYITAGPVIQSFSLTQGETLNRPLTVTGSATAVLGMADMELYVDGVLQTTNAGGSFSHFFDISLFPNAIHQVELLARDLSGNIATLEYNVVIALTPPLAPVITTPATDILTNTDFVTISGTAEPGMNIQVTRNGQIVGVTNADGGGNFTITNALLVEGANTIVAIAANNTGTTPSAARHVTVETIPPAQLVLNPPVYTPGQGLSLGWQFPTTGKQAATFQLFWSAAPFASSSQATNQSPILNSMAYTIHSLANGAYYFGVVGYDAAGNPSPLSALVSTAYDASPPAMAISYGQASPLGAGPLSMVLTSSKALAATPALTLKPFGALSPVLLPLTNVALNTWQTAFNVTPATPSGFVVVLVTARDQLGNVFVGAPAGPPLIIDTAPPTATITTAPAPPVQTVNNTNVTVNVVLSELAAAGTAPALTFAPPAGTNVPVPLAGAGSNWLGTLPLTPAMGSGFGQFVLSAQDSLGNVGTNIVAGGQLEIYNTALPSAPPAPAGLAATSLPGGQVSLTWNAVSNAQIYRLYRQAGSTLVVPTVMVIDDITTNNVVDLPPADGVYSYGVTASRLGSESGILNPVLALSDRAAPPAPTNVAVALAASGVRITWQEPSGGLIPNHYNIYRNGALIQTVATVTPVVDFPPRGTDTYVVAASDLLGNQSSSAPAAIQLLVSPVTSLSVLVVLGQAPVLSWVSNDPTAVVGFNVYRNGVKQNASLLTGANYADNLPLADVVQYAVTAVNISSQESPPRLVNVYPVSLGLEVNPLSGGNGGVLRNDYFDLFQIGVTNLASSSNFPIAQVSLTRTVTNLNPCSVTQTLVASLGPGTSAQQSVVLPESSTGSPQTVQVTANQQTDSGNSSVVYQTAFSLTNVQPPPTEITVFANQLPLAGGLSSFQLQIYNRGYADMDVIVFRGGGSQPGDVYLSVQNGLGQEVGRAAFTGAPPGTAVLGDGTGFVDIQPGASLLLTITNVLLPAALAGATNTTFVAVVTNIYNQLGTPNQSVSGPLSGSMVSSLAQTAYYGTAQTDHSTYANNTPILISGQALSTSTGLPVPNAVLNIGFAASGFRWYQAVTNDSNGNYQYSYTPPVGFGGTITLWAANPLVVDQLNQVQVNVFRLYDNPSFGDITMSKNGVLNFSIALINPGAVPLTGFTTSFSAYQTSGNTQTPVTKITGTNLTPAGFVLGPNQNQSISLQLAATSDAPDNAQVQFTFTSAEGASTTFTGNATLLPAVPVLSVVTPAVGYLQVSVNRGDQQSGQISFMNTGLQTLKGITVTPPTNNWMQLNLPVSNDAQIHLPDLAVGQSNSLPFVFTPPPTTPLAFYQDSITVQGTNSVSPFVVNVYALVTSDLTGAVQFDVSDILGQQVPNASVRLHNDLLQADIGPVYTDTNGLVTITNLQEGSWNWQVVAPGCSANAGTVTIIADQTVSQATTLSRSLVTVTFNVVPVPFTDKYEITVEMTFETHVPAPVLVVNPPFIDFTTFSSGYQTNFTVSVENYGLIQVTGVNISSAQANGAALTPLINYIPVLLPLQSVDVPFTFTFNRTLEPQFINDCLGEALPVQNTQNPDVYVGLASIFSGTAENSDGSGAQTIQSSLSTIGVGISADSPGSLENYVYANIGSVINCIVSQSIPSAAGGAGGGGGSFGGGGGGQGGSASYQPFSNPVYAQAAACFAPETKVLMEDGSFKAISAIQANDIVRTGIRPDNVAVVNATYALASGKLCEVQFAPNDPGAARSVLATDEHQFWVDGRGWVAAGRLAVGDWLFDSQGRRVRVLGNQAVKRSAKVYSFSLSGDTAFYANGVLVHDSCGATPPATQVGTSEVVK